MYIYIYPILQAVQFTKRNGFQRQTGFKSQPHHLLLIWLGPGASISPARVSSFVTCGKENFPSGGGCENQTKSHPYGTVIGIFYVLSYQQMLFFF